MGLFGISEIFLNLEKLYERIVLKTKIKNLFPNKEDWRKSAKPIARGTLLGFFLESSQAGCRHLFFRFLCFGEEIF